MGLTSGNSGFNSLHPVPSGNTSYFWFSKNAFFQTFHHKEHRAGYAWQQRLKSDTRSVWTKDYQKKCLISCAFQGHGKPRRWNQEPRNQIFKWWDYITNAPLHLFKKNLIKDGCWKYRWSMQRSQCKGESSSSWVREGFTKKSCSSFGFCLNAGGRALPKFFSKSKSKRTKLNGH